MSKRRLLVWAALIVFGMAVLTGCGTLGQYFGGKWVAKVNGEKISVDDFNKRLEKVKQSYVQQGLDLNSEQGKRMLDALKKQTVDDMITEQLIIQEAKKENLAADDKKVQTELENIKNNFKTADGKPDNAKYQEALKGQGMTEADLKDYLKVQLTAKALYDKVTAGVTVSDADIQQYYNDNKDSFVDPEKVQARQILLKTEDEAKAVIAELKAGAKFADLAKQKSTDTGTKDNGGELGLFAKGEMVAEFENAAFAQRVGSFSEQPVKTTFGYHVILVEDRKEKVQKTFDQAKDEIKQTLPDKKKGEKFQQYLDELKKKAKIEYAPEYKAPISSPSTTTAPTTK